MKIHFFFATLLFLTSMLLWSGCREQTEGCLDPTATNFDPSADVTCCCTYPKLSVRFAFRNYSTDSTNFALNAVYPDGGGNPFAVSLAQLYLSDFQLVRSDGTTSAVADSVVLPLTNGSTTTQPDDAILLRPNTFRYEIGTLAHFGDFTKIRFRVGLNPAVALTDPSQMPASHPLAPQTEPMYLNAAYWFQKFKIVTDTSDFNTFTTFSLAESVVVEIDYPLSFSQGFDAEFKLNLDFAKLLENVNFMLDNDSTFRAKVVQNTAFAFSVGE